MENLIIKKGMKLQQVSDIIELRMLPKNKYDLLVIAMLLNNCDYIEVEGSGTSAKLNLMKNES